MVAQELTSDEIIAAKKAGINLQQFFAVSYNEDSTPIAIFDSKLMLLGGEMKCAKRHS